MILTLIQNSAKATQEGLSEEKTLTIADLILSGGIGAQIIIGVLFILLFITIYIYLERTFNIKSALKVDDNFMDRIRDNVASGKIEAANVLCDSNEVPVSRMIKKGISRIGKPLEDISKSIENTGRLEVYKLEKNVSLLATVAGAAPMIGFLGTVIGMILAFHEMATAGGQIDVELLSTGIYTAMTTTVAGLIVGIIAFIGYNLLIGRIDKVVHSMEANVMEFMDLLNEPL